MHKVLPYIAMSDRLVVFPNNEVSSAVWDMEDDRSMGTLEWHTTTTNKVVCAEINNVGSMAVTIACNPDDVETFLVKIWSLATMQCSGVESADL